MTTTVSRHFVTMGNRQVHYRRIGEGPVVLMLHISPLSSRTFIPVMNHLAESFTVIAPDRPGYGESDALALEAPEISDYAAALGEAVDAMGVDRMLVYGRATGTTVAVEFARQNPQRVEALVLENLVMVSDEQRPVLLERFAPSLAPQWDGSHLLRAWSWWRDFMLYWPWFDRRLATRLDVDIPSASSLHEDVLDTLRAGTRYDLAPNAVFRYDPLPAIQELNLPIKLMAANRTARSRGASVEWLTRLLEHASSAVVERYSIEPCLMAHQLEPDSLAYRDYASQVERILAGAGAGAIGAAPRVADTAPVAEGLWRSYVDTDHGQVLVRRGGDGHGRPVLLLHDIARSGASVAGLAVDLAADRPVLVPDLAGFGESDPPRDRRGSIEDYLAPIRAVLEAVGIAEVDVYGEGAGALVATELAAQDPRVKSVILNEPPLAGSAIPPDGGAPSLEPAGDGTHLLRAWNRMRDSTLFSPWCRTSRDGIRWSEPDDAATLQDRTLELLKGAAEERPARLATARYSAVERLSACSARTLVIEDSTDAAERVASFLSAASE
jgi:pimeloyl-ACP methyl ester carboxylesterase